MKPHPSISQKLTRGMLLCAVAFFHVSALVNDGAEATVSGACYSLRAGPMTGILPGTGLVSTELTTPDGLSTFPVNVLTNNGQRIFSRELRPDANNPAKFAADYFVFDASQSVNQYGEIRLEATELPDENQDGIPDLFQPALAGSASFAGWLVMDWPLQISGTITGTATRPANSQTGHGFLNVTSDSVVVSYSGPLSITSLDGNVSYEHSILPPPLRSSLPVIGIAATRGSSVVIGAPVENRAVFSVTRRTAGQVVALTSRLTFRIIDADRVLFSAGTWTGEAGAAVYESDSFTVGRRGKSYFGSVNLADGDLATPWADYTMHGILISDANDTDADGIPDLSDPAAPPTTYEWQLDSQPFWTSNVPALTMTAPAQMPEGLFQVIARNASGAATAHVARVVRNEILWATKTGGAAVDYPAAGLITPDRRLIVAGRVEPIPAGNADLASIGRLQNTSLREYNRSGASRLLAGIHSSEFAIPYQVCRHANGDLTLAGEFAGSLQCGTFFLPSNGLTNGFLIRLSEDGFPAWVKTFPKASPAVLARDQNDNLYFAGSAQVGAVIGSVTAPQFGLVVAKATAAGDVVWAKFTPADELVVGDIGIDSDGNVFVTGGEYGADGPGFSKQIFVRKHTSAGVLTWNLQAGGNGHDHGVKLAMEPNGDLYLAAFTPSSWLRIDNAEAPDFRDGDSATLLKISSTGRVIWARFVNSQISSVAMPLNLRVIPMKGPILLGVATETAIRIGDLTAPVSFNDGYYLAQFDSSGNARSLQTIPIPLKTSVGWIGCDELGEISMSFVLSNPIDFGGFHFEPQMADWLTIYIGRPMKPRATAWQSTLAVTWPKSWPEVWLQSSSDLNSTDWLSLTRGVGGSEFDFIYNLQMTNAATFFQLQKPPLPP